jgi:hypothetical protein
MKRIGGNMRAFIHITWVVLTGAPTAALAQTVIEGRVLDAGGRAAVAYVAVSQKGAESILGFADTDKDGHYRLSFTAKGDSVVVTASGLSIDRYVAVLANRSQHFDFRVKERDLNLKEVTVKAEKIRQAGDTLNYTVGAYKQQGDRVIGDVLKRMPGIEVSDDGKIRFNGKAIIKFYVEDMDLLQGRYGLATNNINAGDVATVQVLRNHQPVKMLQGKGQTDDVAINLKLKNSAKGTVAVNAMGGIGGQQSGGWGLASRPLSIRGASIGRNPLWAGELVGMYFSGRRQNMTLYKGNNSGDDVSRELSSHYSSINSVSLYPFCPTNAILPSGSGLPQKRTFDNHSHIVSINHLEKPDKDTELGLNIAYYNDRIRLEGSSVSDRFVNGGERLLIEEHLGSETRVHNLSMQSRYCRNAADGFSANVLKFDAGWNSDLVEGQLSSSSTGTSPSDYGDERIRQHFDRPQLSVSNTFNTLRNIGNRTLNLHFSAGYAQRPNTLDVVVDSVERETSAAYRQDVVSHNIVGDFHTDFAFRFGAFTLNYGVIGHVSLHGIETDLGGFDTGDYSSQNDLWYNTYEIAFGQHYKFERAGWQLSLGCPLNLYVQTLDDRIRNDRHGYTHLLVTPTFSASYSRMDWSGNISTGYSRTVGDPNGIYSGYIMNNYRSFQRSYVEQLSQTDRIDASMRISYENALNALFFNINARYSHRRDNQTYGYDYRGATSVIQAVDRSTTSDDYGVGFDGSKGFDRWMACVRMFCNYSGSTGEELIGGTVFPYRSHTVGVGLGGTITPLPWFNIVLSSGYGWNKSRTDNRQIYPSRMVRTATQRLSLNVYVTRQITLTASAEDNYNNLTVKNRHAWFGDLSVKYKLKRVDLELQANNLFNQKQYTRVSYSGLDIYTQTSQLRPMNIIGTIRFKLL